jgi:two-component SAPR family response regulator
MDDYLAKPVTLADLQRVIDMWCGTNVGAGAWETVSVNP